MDKKNFLKQIFPVIGIFIFSILWRFHLFTVDSGSLATGANGAYYYQEVYYFLETGRFYYQAPPLLFLLLSVFVLIFGDIGIGIKIGLSVLGALGGLSLYFIGKKTTKSHILGLIAFISSIFYPDIVNVFTTMWKQSIAIYFIPITLYFSANFIKAETRKEKIISILVSGSFGALCALTHVPTTALLISSIAMFYLFYLLKDCFKLITDKQTNVKISNSDSNSDSDSNSISSKPFFHRIWYQYGFMIEKIIGIIIIALFILLFYLLNEFLLPYEDTTVSSTVGSDISSSLSSADYYTDPENFTSITTWIITNLARPPMNLILIFVLFGLVFCILRNKNPYYMIIPSIILSSILWYIVTNHYFRNRFLAMNAPASILAFICGIKLFILLIRLYLPKIVKKLNSEMISKFTISENSKKEKMITVILGLLILSPILFQSFKNSNHGYRSVIGQEIVPEIENINALLPNQGNNITLMAQHGEEYWVQFLGQPVNQVLGFTTSLSLNRISFGESYDLVELACLILNAEEKYNREALIVMLKEFVPPGKLEFESFFYEVSKSQPSNDTLAANKMFYIKNQSANLALIGLNHSYVNGYIQNMIIQSNSDSNFIYQGREVPFGIISSEFNSSSNECQITFENNTDTQNANYVIIVPGIGLIDQGPLAFNNNNFSARFYIEDSRINHTFLIGVDYRIEGNPTQLLLDPPFLINIVPEILDKRSIITGLDYFIAPFAYIDLSSLSIYFSFVKISLLMPFNGIYWCFWVLIIQYFINYKKNRKSEEKKINKEEIEEIEENNQMKPISQ